MRVLGCIFSLYLAAFVFVFWKDGVKSFGGFLGQLCATITVVMIGLFMWRGMLLP